MSMTMRDLKRPVARWRARLRRLGEQWATTKAEWEAERALERAIAGDGPLIVGPWISEVGYEVLYWIPFLRWVLAAYRIRPDRVVAMSRGGTASWYSDIAARYVEVFDWIAPADLAARAAAGELKQREISALDRRLLDHASETLRLRNPAVMHPSLLFRWFSPFWSGHEGVGFVERHTRHARIVPPRETLPVSMPSDYVAVKFYGARALPNHPRVRGQVQSIVAALAERTSVVQLDTGVAFDEHADVSVSGTNGVIRLSGQLDPRTNLGVQTQIISGARLFVGTCGSLAWLAPLLGIDTVPVLTDTAFLHAHLHVARRVYGRVGGGRFSPLDLSGIVDAGLLVGRDDRVAATVRVP